MVRSILQGAMGAYAGLLLLASVPSAAAAQIEIHEDGEAHSHGLHFSHPLVAESVSPDTKGRLDLVSTRIEEGGAKEWITALALEAEYAFHRAFSVEVQLPYGVQAGSPGETHLGLKFANYAFEERGVLLGYGVDLGLPTGDFEAPGHELVEHDTTAAGEHEDLYEIEPYLNVGWMHGRWELVGFAVFSIPTDLDPAHEASTGLALNASALYHASNRLMALLEYDGLSGLSGDGAGAGFANLSPGVKVVPFAGSTLQIGVSAGFPVVDRDQFDTRLKVSAFYHF